MTLVPSPRTEHRRPGQLTVPADATIALRGTARDAVADLPAELRAVTGLPLAEAAGDAFITVSVAEPCRPSRYRIKIESNGIEVAGGDRAGAFYGLQQVLKLLVAAPDRRTLPLLEVADEPAMAVRGVMIDAGRRFWSPRTLRALVRDLAWWHGNRLQLHLTEWNGFRVRLSDERFSGLATEPAYTSAEIRDLIGYARKWHVELVPEIDLPAHATAMIEQRPSLRFADGGGGAPLNDGSYFTGGPTPSWTVDITKAANRQWLRDLVSAFGSELDPVAVHLGADEWPPESEMAGCAELSGYATGLDPAYNATDAMVHTVNDLASVVRAQGRRAEIWNWWEHASKGEFRLWPDRDTVVTAWPDDPSQLGWFTAAGYRVVASPATTHYVTPRTYPGNRPTTNYVVADPRWLYETWHPDERMDGYQLCVWSDWAEEQPDEYFLAFAHRPLQAMLDRCWGGARRRDADAFFDAVDATARDRGPDRLLGTGQFTTLPPDATLTRIRFRPIRRLTGSAAGNSGKWTAADHAALDALVGTVFTGFGPDGAVPLGRVDTPPSGVWTQLSVGAVPVRRVSCDRPMDVQWYGFIEAQRPSVDAPVNQ
ncbi:MAG TPA: family 20 glycosylhydrolase [Candidatus Limnocylindrales bacterium]